ncbi:hypothetical protein BY458DRAFT_523292 [Sporodiniella umbellata]|nr:hypothetical protein BY458DRAFT_523292 [Sporodiniella umbellata]
MVTKVYNIRLFFFLCNSFDNASTNFTKGTGVRKRRNTIKTESNIPLKMTLRKKRKEKVATSPRDEIDELISDDQNSQSSPKRRRKVTRSSETKNSDSFEEKDKMIVSIPEAKKNTHLWNKQ